VAPTGAIAVAESTQGPCEEYLAGARQEVDRGIERPGTESRPSDPRQLGLPSAEIVDAVQTSNRVIGVSISLSPLSMLQKRRPLLSPVMPPQS
jgi:hypothetical protein